MLFRRLVMDTQRSVRAEAVGLQGELVAAAGKASAPYLK